MKKVAIGLLSLVFFVPSALAVERVRYATHFKGNPHYWLPVAAAMEQGYWREPGLEVNWIMFDSTTTMDRAVAAGELDVGTSGLMSLVPAVVRGVPEMIAADPKMNTEFFFWVLATSRLRQPSDLKGAKIGVTRYGAASHNVAQAVAKALGIEKDVKFVSMGGGGSQMGGLVSRAIDAANLSFFTMAALVARGEVRALLNTEDYLPKGLAAQIIYAHTEYVKKKPEAVAKIVRGFLQGADFTMKSQEWAIAKMKEVTRFSDAAAKIAFPELRYGKDGKIEVKKIENAVAFLIQYGIIPREKVPPLEKLYVRDLIP